MRDDVLAALLEADELEGPELADKLDDMASTSMHQHLQNLEKQGLVDIRRKLLDGRVNVYSLTEEGRMRAITYANKDQIKTEIASMTDEEVVENFERQSWDLAKQMLAEDIVQRFKNELS